MHKIVYCMRFRRRKLHNVANGMLLWIVGS